MALGANSIGEHPTYSIDCEKRIQPRLVGGHNGTHSLSGNCPLPPEPTMLGSRRRFERILSHPHCGSNLSKLEHTNARYPQSRRTPARRG